MSRHTSWGDVVRSLWFLPAVFVAIAMVAGYLLSQIELPEDFFLSDLVFRGTADNARQLLAVISTTMITVTGLVFVLTVIALQIASTQFSPRLMRSFLRDPGTRLVLSFFVATFAYSLAGLFTVGQATAEGEAFVPQLAVTGSLVLALVSVGMLVYYIQHITNSIRIDTVMRGVRTTTISAIERNYPNPLPPAGQREAAPPVPNGAAVVPVGRSGYIQQIDTDGLQQVALEFDATVRVVAEVGHHLVAGSRLAWIWPHDPAQALDGGELSQAVNSAVTIASERTVENDVGFGLRQLVDIAGKAVAPSVNDPYTAVQAIQHISIVMAALAGMDTTGELVKTDAGNTIVFVPRPSFELLLETACGHVRRSATRRPRVLVALLRMLETVGAATPSPSRREAVVQQIRLIVEDAERDIPQPADLEPILAMAAIAADAADR